MTQFPQVAGSNLEGRRFTLPQEFEGELNLALIAFEQWHQEWIDTWTPFVGQMKAQFPGLRSYELPVIWPMGWMRERMVDLNMRMNIPDRAVRETTITLYTDIGAFLKALDLPDTRRTYTLLVDRAGTVLARADGPFRLEAGRALRDAIAQQQRL